MSQNSKRMAAELADLGYEPASFNAPVEQGGGEGVSFAYQIQDGSRVGDSVTLAVALRLEEGNWPEVAPHWLYVSPPDAVLEEQVKGSRSPGAVSRHVGECGTEWMAISAPPSDFWDHIEPPDSKGMEIYLDRHIRRIWSAR